MNLLNLMALQALNTSPVGCPPMRRTLLLTLLACFSLASAATVTIKPGDTLYGIARQNGTTLPALLAVNKGVNPQVALRVGQVLQLPARGGTIARSPSTAVVRPTSIRVSAVMPVQGRLTSPYSSSHPGLDLAAPVGTPIRAALAGRVMESRYDGRTDWGWTVLLDHGNGLTSRYSHNSANFVRVGDWVAAGALVARVGSTGNSTGPHLDYRVMVNGRVINPFTIH